MFEIMAKDRMQFDSFNRETLQNAYYFRYMETSKVVDGFCYRLFDDNETDNVVFIVDIAEPFFIVQVLGEWGEVVRETICDSFDDGIKLYNGLISEGE